MALDFVFLNGLPVKNDYTSFVPSGDWLKTTSAHRLHDIIRGFQAIPKAGSTTRADSTNLSASRLQTWSPGHEDIQMVLAREREKGRAKAHLVLQDGSMAVGWHGLQQLGSRAQESSGLTGHHHGSSSVTPCIFKMLILRCFEIFFFGP